MPIYEYKCEKCGKVFEFQQRMSDSPLIKCPEAVCEHEEKGEGDVHRIISKNIGLVFNGSGFYQTDYKKSHVAPPTAEKTEAAPATTTCAAAEGGSCSGCAKN